MGLKGKLSLFAFLALLVMLPLSAASNESDSDVLVVPAGTEIRVIYKLATEPGAYAKGKVVAPVRVGWTTAIPAGSVTTMSFFGEHVEVISVEVDKNTHKLETTQLPIQFAAPGTEVTFALMKPLRILR